MDNQDNNLGQHLPIENVFASHTNPRKRFNQDALAKMAESIKAQGVIQPILVRPHPSLKGQYEIVAGESRWRASNIADKDTIPCVIKELTDLQALELQVMENLHRQDLHPLEEARGFKQLLDKTQEGDLIGFTADDLAVKISKSPSYVYGALKLNELCTYAQDAFLDDKIKKDTAILIARIPGEQLQTQATKEMIKGPGNEPLSVRAAKALLHLRYTLDLNKAQFDRHSIVLVPAAGSCLSCPKRSGNYPELYSDIESADVCTDPDCFASKKKAHALKVVETAPNVVSGDAVKEIFPHGPHYAYNGYKVADATFREHGLAESYEKLLGDDMPEATLVVFNDGEIKQVYLETSLAAKIQQKIDSGELLLPKKEPQEKSQQDIERELKIHNQAEEEKRRLSILMAISRDLIAAPHQTGSVILRLAIDIILHNYDVNLEVVNTIYGWEAERNGLIPHFQSTPQPILELERMLAVMILSNGVDTNWSWESELDNAQDDDYQQIITFISNLGQNPDEFLDKAINPYTPPTAAPAEENNAPEKLEENTLSIEPAAQAEKPLPPKMQAIKDAELAKRARRDQRQKQKESANADVKTGAAEATQTSEVPNV